MRLLITFEAWPGQYHCTTASVRLGHAAVETDADIETMSDDISYSKGASVLRMLRAYLTREMSPSPRLRRALQQVRGSLSAPHCM